MFRSTSRLVCCPESFQLVPDNVHWELLWLLSKLLFNHRCDGWKNEKLEMNRLKSIWISASALVCNIVRTPSVLLYFMPQESHIYNILIYHPLLLLLHWWWANKPHSRASLSERSVQWRLPQKVGPLVSGRFKKNYFKNYF